MQETFPNREQEKSIDDLLDERNILTKELGRIIEELENLMINHSDSVNKEEQINDLEDKVFNASRLSVLVEEIKKIDIKLAKKTK